MRRILAVLTAVYSVPSAALPQTTLNLSQDLVRLGIASTNMLPNRPDIDAGPLFFWGGVYAQNHQIGRVIADPGAYYFPSLQYAGAHVSWDKLSNLTIDLQGSDLYFSHPLVQGILITNSTNITVQNFTMDYNPLPFTQVRVVSVNPAQQSVQFAVDGNWQNPSVLNAVFPTVPNAHGFGVEVHMFRNGRPIPGVTRMYANNPVGTTQFTATPDPGVNPGALFAQIRPGDIAFLGMRAGSGPFSVLGCTGCTFRNLAAYSGTQWGFWIVSVQSSVFEHLYAVPRPGTDRLASNYVGLWLTDTGPGNQVRLNRTVRSMDDSFGYTSTFIGAVKRQTDNRTFVLEGSITTKLSFGDSVPNGSGVAFQRLSDGAIVETAAIASQVAPPNTGQQPYQVTYTFDRDLPPSIVGSLMFGTDPSQRAGNSVVERNAVEEETDCCGGFLVAGLLNSAFHGNYIQRSGMAGVRLENSPNPAGFALPPCGNITISNNVVDSANWTPTSFLLLQLGSILVDSLVGPRPDSASPHQGIAISSNFIADSGGAAVWLENTNGGSVSGNQFINADNNPAVASEASLFGPTGQPLVVRASQNIAIANNIVDQTWRRMWVTDGQYRELAAYAPGTTVRLNAYALATLFPAPGVTLTDADGDSTPLTVRNVTAHAIDVQIPAAAPLGGAYLTLTSGSVKYFGTLFVDSVDNIPALNGCTYEMSPSAVSAAAGAGNLPILVVTQTGCSYQVSASTPFVNPGAGGAGIGVVSAGFTANAGAARSATIEIAGQMFTVTQDAPGAAAQPNSVKAIAGDGQSGPAGFPLPAPVVVEVRDNLGNPVARAVVTFAGTNATVSPASVQTDAMGHAGALVTPGAAGVAKVTATVSGLPSVAFNFTAIQATTALTVQKTWQAVSGGNPLRGDTFTYTIKVTNSGNAPAMAVNLKDTPDTRAELAMQGPLTFNLGALAPGASQTVSIKVSASAAGVYLNNAMVTWSDSAGNLGSTATATSTTVARQPGDFASNLQAPVPLNNGVRQVRADGANVYVVNNPGDSLTILNCATGACSITSTVALGAGAQPVAVITMDVDGDGQNDVLVLNQGTGTIAALLSGSPGMPQFSNVGAGPVAFAPFHARDGLPRIAVAFPGAITIFVWDGQQFQPGTTVVAGASPSAMVCGDFNGDGADDLLVADTAAGTVQVLLGDGMGGLNPTSVLPVGANPVALAVGDVDNSRSLDAVVITSAGLVVLLNDGTGNLAAQSAIPAAGAGDVLLADFNGDGNLDLAVANTGGSSISLYRGDGSGTFVAAGSYLTGKAPVSLASSDLDNDGTADLICGDGGSQDLVLLMFSAARP